MKDPFAVGAAPRQTQILNLPAWADYLAVDKTVAVYFDEDARLMEGPYRLARDCTCFPRTRSNTKG